MPLGLNALQSSKAMIGSLFSIRYVSVQCEDWERKKVALKLLLKESEFERRDLAQFETDRRKNQGRYIGEFCQIFNEELNRFGMEMGLSTLNMKAAWSVRYRKGDYHGVHNHGSLGYSGILYLDYDDQVHTPSIHVSPWNDPISDMTSLSAPSVREGSLVFVPSNVLHYTRPNESDKLRSIVAFDLDIQ